MTAGSERHGLSSPRIDLSVPINPHSRITLLSPTTHPSTGTPVPAKDVAMLNTLLPPRIRRVALGLVAAGSVAISGAIVAASPAAAADPLVAACVITAPNTVAVSLEGPVGVSGPVLVTLRDSNGAVIGFQSVTLLNGVLTLPPLTATLPAGSNGIVTYTVTNLLGTVLVTGSTPCAELPVGAVVGGYQALSPARLLDTRTGLGGARIGAGQSVNLQITGRGGVPTANVGAVYLNFVATGGTAPGYLTVFPTGGSSGGVSSLNYLQGPNVANAVISKVGTGGMVTIRNVSAGSVDLVGDVGGYFISGLVQGLLLPGAYKPLAGTRIADSRRSFGLTKLMGTASQNLQVTGKAGVPAGARSVVVNLTAVNGSLHSHITAWETGKATPNASNVNYTGSKPAANLAAVPLSPSGQISVKNGTGATNVDLVVDVVGYFQGGLLPAQTAGLESPLTPFRLLDTRTGNGAPLGKVAPFGTVSLQVANRGGVPNTRLRAVLVTVTTTQEDASGDIIAYPSGTPSTTTSVLSFSRFTDIANLAIVRVGTDGKIRLTNRSSQPTHLVVDVAGYFTGNTIQIGS